MQPKRKSSVDGRKGRYFLPRGSAWAIAWLLLLGGVSVAAADSLDTWNKRTSNFGLNLYGVAYGHGKFVAVGMGGAILLSTNGSDWQNVSSGVQTNLFGVAFGADSFLAVGAGGAILRSTNAANWTAQSSPTTNQLNSVAHYGSQFLATGVAGTILTSPDGATWMPQVSGTARSLMGSARGNGVFVIVGQGSSNPGAILTSSNTVDWVDRSANLGVAFYAVAFGNGVFVAMDARGAPYTSTNGISWTRRSSAAGGDYLYAMAFAHGLFVGAGAATSGGQRIVTSPTGGAWKLRPVSTQHSGPLRSITYGNGYFIAAGEKGIIVQSGPMASLRFAAGGAGTAALVLDGEIGRTYDIQACSNLTDWTGIFTITNTAEATPFVDPEAGGSAARFYRALTSDPQ